MNAPNGLICGVRTEKKTDGAATAAARNLASLVKQSEGVDANFSLVDISAAAATGMGACIVRSPIKSAEILKDA